MKRISLSIFFLSFLFISFAQLNIEELGYYSYDQRLSDIWGHADANGNEYALVGTYDGFSIVDVTTPSSLTEVYYNEGVESIWRDIKTWDNHAYVSTEGGGGILIVDMNPLPGDITTSTYYTGDVYPFQSVHNIYIDEFGKLYIFGANNGNGGAIICDLTADPMNPVELGRFDDFYLHDGMARGDTLWGGGIYLGVVAAIDVSDPSSPELVGNASTPSQFCHNAWISDDGTHIFTTDEVSGGYIGSFDVTNLSNIVEVDRIQSNPLSMVIPHNAHVLDDYIVTSYYADGVTIHDADRPHNLVEVGNYDTSPDYEGNGFNGSWGVYPFLPSGNLVASDIEMGLYVLKPTYVRASYLEGVITDSITGAPIVNAVIRIQPTNVVTFSDIDGSYACGMPESGTYDVEIIHEDYPSKLIEDVEFMNGVLTDLNVALSNFYTGISNSIDEADINIYPNPSTSAFKLDHVLKNADLEQIHVYDLTGRMVEEIAVDNQTSNYSFGSELPKGTYFIKVLDENGRTLSRKITKL